MRKYFYILITLLAVLSIGFVGCKNKPTAVADEANEVTGGTDFNPMGEIKGYGGYNFSDYAGNFFWSVKEYYKSGNSGEKFRYSLEIKKSGSSTIAEVKGYNNGEAFTKSYTGGSWTVGNKFPFGYNNGFLQFDSTNTSNKYAYLTADGLKNIKLALSNSN